MDYSLAKKLRDAGFPSLAKQDLFMSPEEVAYGLAKRRYVQVPIYPTLEELIEACGGDGFSLAMGDTCGNGDEWCAARNEQFGLLPNGEGYGNTPSEAVARLWLALHGKTEDIKTE